MSTKVNAGAGPTPLLDMPDLARRCGVQRVLVKAENTRHLGNFKSLGGGYAVAQALARAKEEHCRQHGGVPFPMPALLCASDGNHGLAVASAAREAGTRAIVYLPRTVGSGRTQRIADAGAKIVRVDGTYDDAVAEAAQAARAGDGLLIADTTEKIDDPVIADVMDGYALIATEVVAQLGSLDLPNPTHLFLQAGVGGFAAAMVKGLEQSLSAPRRIVVVEPAIAACVAAGLRAGRPVKIGGSLETCAEMLSCGLASAPALALLLDHHTASLELSEETLRLAPAEILRAGGPGTTPSGAAGVAGLIATADDVGLRKQFELDGNSVVLLFVTEAFDA